MEKSATAMNITAMSIESDSAMPSSAVRQAAIIGVANPSDVPVPPMSAMMKTKSTTRPNPILETHERTVGKPPRPVKDRPILHETGFENRVGPGVESHEILQHETQAVSTHLQLKEGGAGDQDKNNEDAGQDHVRVAEPLDTFFEA